MDWSIGCLMWAFSCIALNETALRRDEQDGVSAESAGSDLRGWITARNSIPMYAGGREARTAGI